MANQAAYDAHIAGKPRIRASVVSYLDRAEAFLAGYPMPKAGSAPARVTLHGPAAVAAFNAGLRAQTPAPPTPKQRPRK